MTAAGAWTLGLALVYTLALIAAGQVAKRRAGRGDSYFVGGRQFTALTVALCVTGLFSGSSFIAILELSYHTGISAIWYGIAETVQILLIALVFIGPFRRRMVVTISGMIGDRFGRAARGVAGAITAFAFPMWSVATAIAFASALHAFTGLSIHIAVVFTALLLLLYLSSGGMWSIAFTQAVNCVAFLLMLLVGLVAFFIEPGWGGFMAAAASRPESFDMGAVGLPLIIAWFGTFIVNVILAQATFQMAGSCKTPAEGRRGLLLAALFGVPLIIGAVGFGMAAEFVLPDQQLGLVAVPLYISQVLPAPLVGVFFLGVWACTLGWAAPCQFSGATSLGRDVGQAINPKANGSDLVRYTRWSLIAMTGLMIVFGFLRTEQSAWWNVLAWTLRNGATFAPVLGVLLWPLATRRAVHASLITGFLTGILWYQLGDWRPDSFFLGVHPVWVGMSVNLFTMVAVTLLGTGGSARLGAESPARRRAGLGSLAASVALALVTGFGWTWLHPTGMSGLAVFCVLVTASLAAFLLIRRAEEPPADVAPVENAAPAAGAVT
ncbi:sodium:solute symporter family protein [Pseudonocardia asaccharolytica]|uniref:3-guanidinopropionate transporter n=1 Tax=Pseudonocardia asaccharolytica DSM 44247 = NBRC 16224 TaxID=1123024 RepID=A0A511D082_9PSEU|nr:sodium:solute symporter family protein [Pseudonocardia asaccharolytica]GEL17933.1 3-guanidinopropionate transporter [Pseudonocardia asaccharolytica DSM 44247 = NBRC 16224]